MFLKKKKKKGISSDTRPGSRGLLRVGGINQVFIHSTLFAEDTQCYLLSVGSEAKTWGNCLPFGKQNWGGGGNGTICQGYLLFIFLNRISLKLFRGRKSIVHVLFAHKVYTFKTTVSLNRYLSSICELL